MRSFFPKFKKETLQIIFLFVGSLIFAFGGGSVIYSLIKTLDEINVIEWSYLGLLLIPVGVSLLVYGLHGKWIVDRREIESSEINILIREVDYFSRDIKDPAVKALVDKELDQIQNSTEKLLELSVLPLRKLLVDLYPEEELFTKAKEELKRFQEAMWGEPEDNKQYEKWEHRIKRIMDDVEKDVEGSKEVNIKKLRAELKAIREDVAWYDQTWAIGEVYIKCISYWATVSVLCLLLVGLLPLIYPGGSKILDVLHWLALGCSGALLSRLVSLNELDVNEVGESDGKQVLLQSIGRASIGAMTSVLLYAAILGGLITGTIFPELPILDPLADSFWSNTGLSIFWGIFAGFSLNILTRLAKMADSALT